jgi:lipopolysaccharide/colanic/teichoic acid biosynthesis glycosyltransferase
MYITIKRQFDLIFAFIILFIALPIIVLTTILLFIVNSGSPFFFQLRPGKNEKIFKLIKFKTMNDKKDSTGKLLEDRYRITKIGSFVRQTSIDELLQLINVLKGDMSLIGPRPLLIEYLSIYDIEQKKRHNVKPGVTGWAQINGRNLVTWQKKFELDLFYVNNISFILDLKIFFLTIKKIIFKEGISAENHVTIEKFNGNN